MYSPYIFGVQHIGENATETVRRLLSLNVKSVGLEAPPSLLSAEPTVIFSKYGPRSHQMYWSYVAMQLRKKGILVIPLVPESFQRRAGAIWKERLDPENKLVNRANILIFNTLARKLRENVVKHQVEVIVCGVLHAHLLQKELKISKEKYELIHQVEPRSLRKLVLTQTRETRKFRKKQKDIRKPRKNQ